MHGGEDEGVPHRSAALPPPSFGGAVFVSKRGVIEDNHGCDWDSDSDSGDPAVVACAG